MGIIFFNDPVLMYGSIYGKSQYVEFFAMFFAMFINSTAVLEIVGVAQKEIG